MCREKEEKKGWFNFKLIIILVAIFIVIPIIIFGCLFWGYEKGYETSWAIGVGFYGSLISGVGTIIAFLVTSYQTNKIQNENMKFNLKQLRLNNIYKEISEYEKLIYEINSFNQLVTETQYIDIFNTNIVREHCNKLLEFTHNIKWKSLIVVEKTLKDDINHYFSSHLNSKVCDLKYNDIITPELTENIRKLFRKIVNINNEDLQKTKMKVYTLEAEIKENPNGTEKIIRKAYNILLETRRKIETQKGIENIIVELDAITEKICKPTRELAIEMSKIQDFTVRLTEALKKKYVEIDKIVEKS
ncbi:hypothetical protein [Clostridium sardiniense]|uniref:hypothetical protein n=1 Tax=Clostridium sardiniense TaxID=29369 RepID=UPI003D356728